MDISLNGFSVTQMKLVEKLQDGMPHTQESLMLALDPEGYASKSTLKVHISDIRKILKKRGQNIVFRKESEGGMYQWVRNIIPHNDGRI